MPKRSYVSSAPVIFGVASLSVLALVMMERNLRQSTLLTVQHTVTSEDGEESEAEVITSLSTEMLAELDRLLKDTAAQPLTPSSVKTLEFFTQSPAQTQSSIIAYLGKELSRRKRYNEAISFIEQLTPEDRVAQQCSFDFARALSGSGFDDRALEAYAEHIEAYPNHHASHVNYAILLARYGRHEEAVSVLDRAVEIASSSKKGKVLSLRGISLFALGRYSEAVSSFEESIIFRPDNAPTWRRLATARGYLDDVASTDVIETFRRADALAPGNATTHRRWAGYYFSQGRFDEGLLPFRTATRLAPGNDDIVFARTLNLLASERPAATRRLLRSVDRTGQSKIQQNRFDLLSAILSGTRRDVQQQLDAWPENQRSPEDLYLLLVAHLDIDDLGAATAMREQITGTSEFNNPADFAIGRHLYRHENPAEASMLFSTLANVVPESPLTRLYQARSELAIGNIDTALESFSAAYRLQPLSRKITLEYADALRGTQRAGEAIPVLTQYLEQKPRDTRALTSLAALFQDLDMSAEAEETYGVLYRLAPDNIDIGFEYATTQYGSGKLPEALATIDDLVERAPARIDTRLLRVRILISSGLANEARNEIDRITRLDPNNPELRALRATIDQN